MLAGNVVALLSPIIFVPVLTYAFGPQRYDYKSMAEIRLGNDSEIAAAAHTDLELIPGGDVQSAEKAEAEKQQLHRSFVIAASTTAFLTLSLLVLWPMPMYGSGYIFSKPFFTGWIVVGIMWLMVSTFCVGLFPLWEGRTSMARTFSGIYKDLSGRNGAAKRAPVIEGTEESDPGSDHIVEKEAHAVTQKVG